MKMETSHLELQSMLVELLCEGFPNTFAELHHLLYGVERSSAEQHESRDFTQRVRRALMAAETAKRQGDSQAVIHAYLAITQLYSSHQPRLSTFFVERALDLARASGSAALECLVLHDAVAAYEALNDIDAAVAAAEAHKAAAARAASITEETAAAGELVRVYRKKAGQVEGKADGAAALQEVIRTRLMELSCAQESDGAGRMEAEALATCSVGRAYMSAGQPQYGVSYFKQYLKLSKQIQAETDAPEHVAQAYASLAAAHQSQGLYDAASECLHELLAVAEANGDSSAHAHALESIGILRAKQGAYRDAEMRLSEGYKLRKELMEAQAAGASRPELERCRILLGVVKAAGKDGGSRASALFDHVLKNNIRELLNWKVNRQDLITAAGAPKAESEAVATA